MNYQVSNLPIYQIITYTTIGVLLYIGFYIVRNYFLPMLKSRQYAVAKVWQKIQIVVWLIFSCLFFIALLKTNMPVTISIVLITLGLGWNYWRDVFAGIVIKYNSQFSIGQTLHSDRVHGEVIAINLANTEMKGENGERVMVPNSMLRASVVKHIFKKSDVQSYTFDIETTEDISAKKILESALNCPYITANQKIEITYKSPTQYQIMASIIDSKFIDQVHYYFRNLDTPVSI